MTHTRRFRIVRNIAIALLVIGAILNALEGQYLVAFSLLDNRRDGGAGIMRKETLGDGIEFLLGDCSDLIGSLPVDDTACVTDPPYGIGHVKGASGAGRLDSYLTSIGETAS
jgi:hypothetical protein